MKIVTATFKNGKTNFAPKTYNFKCEETVAKTLKQDDYVIVDTQHGLQIACVSEIIEHEFEWELMPVICRAPIDEYIAEKKREERLAALEEEMETRYEEVEPIIRYKQIAQKDGEMKKLVEEYERLIRGH